MTIRTQFFVVGGDTLVIVDRLRDEFTNTFLNNEIVQAEVQDSTGATLFGPDNMEFVGGNTNGRYRLSIPDPGFVAGQVFTLIITTSAGGRDFRGEKAMNAQKFNFS